ncbi:HAD-IA family hydrolase [Pelovirga terrestris]|uniref:HAD family hydrolase n=1 Tax=Pelovirga terrestris TaxID=2771352 RepID=UPI00308022AA
MTDLLADPQPQILIFDLDGTLINSIPDLLTAINLLRQELELTALTASQVARMVGDGATMLVQRALGDDLYDKRHLERFLEIYSRHLLDQTHCYPGIEELLMRHDPRRMALVTNKPILYTRRILAGLDLARFFGAVIGGDSFPHKKPHPYPLQQALLQLDGRPHQAMMIGDHHTDLYAARDAGIATCFCAYGFGHCGDYVPDYQVADARDLLTLLPGKSH